jgi:predicted DNA-binding transcriptional regulator AlpA
VGRKVDVDDLVGAAEIAARLGVKRPQVVHEWRKRHPEFPEPVVTLSNGLIWDWRDVERWAQDTSRLTR